MPDGWAKLLIVLPFRPHAEIPRHIQAGADAVSEVASAFACYLVAANAIVLNDLALVHAKLAIKRQAICDG